MTTELYLRPKLQKNMIALRLDGGKEDWTGGLLSKNYHLTFIANVNLLSPYCYQGSLERL